jgi:uncharacterized protein (DUF952 family)
MASCGRLTAAIRGSSFRSFIDPRIIMPIIYHITTPEAWAEGQTQQSYASSSLSSEGFIHCSTPAQIVATANRYYAGVHGLQLLAIDTDRVRVESRTENLTGGSELFPHIYGPLNPDAVIGIFPFEPGPDGIFTHLPAHAPTE